MNRIQHNYLKIRYFFEKIIALLAAILLLPIMAMIYVLSSLDTHSHGIFIQERVGQYGKIFRIYKFKTINDISQNISQWGAFLRKSKLDELPQLFNILKGEMSFIGPRPDIAGYYNQLQGEYRAILQLKPGLLSTASLKYRNEEFLLKQQSDPLKYNDKVLFPDKVKMNFEYLQRLSFKEDMKIIGRAVHYLLK
ncbi:sugar transferase [Riemerella columbina]|uniref:sugar transferase n=1 Tax=Riemerella columbina TaxID=103810 RepID=UPI0026706E00|nr:sugar transferase [Riemerella columbina]WKS96143.1 sugar transferase [Riemerella columbina]